MDSAVGFWLARGWGCTLKDITFSESKLSDPACFPSLTQKSISLFPMSEVVGVHVQNLSLLQERLICHAFPVPGPLIQNWYCNVSPSGSVAIASKLIGVPTF